jgi:hypothetical protein
MACNLHAGKTLHAGSNPFGSPPTFAVSCWVYPLAQAQQAVVGIGEALGNWSWLALTAGGKARAYRSSIAWAETANSYALQSWNHLYGYFAGNSYREVALNGGPLASSSTTGMSGQFVRTWIGDPNSSWYLQGWVAEVACWDQTLTADERAALARGLSPLVVRPHRLIRYWPLLNVERLRCLTSGELLLPSGGPTTARHVPVVQASRPQLVLSQPDVASWWWRQFVLRQAS